METIRYKMSTLRQTVARAKEAKGNKWSYEGMDPRFRVTSPGDIYEYHIKNFDELVNEIEYLIEKLGG